MKFGIKAVPSKLYTPSISGVDYCASLPKSRGDKFFCPVCAVLTMGCNNLFQSAIVCRGGEIPLSNIIFGIKLITFVTTLKIVIQELFTFLVIYCCVFQ